MKDRYEEMLAGFKKLNNEIEENPVDKSYWDREMKLELNLDRIDQVEINSIQEKNKIFGCNSVTA